MRCFAACWPDEATRSRLDRAAALAHALHPRARRVRRENLHLTLAFIGELPEPAAQRAAQALRGIELEPFAWTLDHIGRFERARVLWAGGPAQPQLAQLAERVRGLLRDAKIDFDRKAFAAHVTLLRDLPPGAHELVEPIEAFAWPIHAALLLVSEPDARGATVYRVLDPR
jgi:2'-5' RNA ligase